MKNMKTLNSIIGLTAVAAATLLMTGCGNKEKESNEYTPVLNQAPFNQLTVLADYADSHSVVIRQPNGYTLWADTLNGRKSRYFDGGATRQSTPELEAAAIHYLQAYGALNAAIVNADRGMTIFDLHAIDPTFVAPKPNSADSLTK